MTDDWVITVNNGYVTWRVDLENIRIDKSIDEVCAAIKEVLDNSSSVNIDGKVLLVYDLMLSVNAKDYIRKEFKKNPAILDGGPEVIVL